MFQRGVIIDVDKLVDMPDAAPVQHAPDQSLDRRAEVPRLRAEIAVNSSPNCDRRMFCQILYLEPVLCFKMYGFQHPLDRIVASAVVHACRNDYADSRVWKFLKNFFRNCKLHT